MENPKRAGQTGVTLTGQLERIVYENEESGFVVARVNVRGMREPVTVVGPLVAVSPGEVIVMEGQWTNHPVFGEQFKVTEYRTQLPVTVEGIKKYLGSGMIKGIGPVMAERITKKFGQKTLEVMEKEIGRLATVEGIGPKRVEMIREAWNEQKGIRDVMVFLQSHGVGTGYAVKIYKTYGAETIDVVTSNPYRLASDVAGIGFLIADRIAASLGFAKDSPVRVCAGVGHVLTGLADDGHVFYPYGMLVEKSMEILGVARTVVEQAIAEEARAKRLIIEDIGPADGSLVSGKGVYLAGYYMCETGIAHKIKELVSSGKLIREIDTKRALQWVQEKLSIRLAKKQAEAVRTAVTSKMMVITGGPGTGKTTIVKAVLKIVKAIGAVTILAAPTGRAANKLKEATGHEARTIHRILEYSMAKGGFQRNENRPLECDLVVIDEASMIDTVLMYHLLKAVPSHAVLVLVGDVNQLPSVGPGNVLNDIISSGIAPVVTLNEIFRQARKSRIVVNAHLINQGIVPETGGSQVDGDFFFIEQNDPERAVEVITELVTHRIPDRFGLDPFDDIQVLTPMHKGSAGAVNLNARLQKALNPAENGIVRGETTLAPSDKVMQVRNNYDKEVFNGDIGRISVIDHDARQVTVMFDGRGVVYDFSELDELVLAYAISVHKSQGSEYPAVVMPVLTQHYIMLWRNLIYTAVTRGRRLVVMVGTKRALAIGVNNNRTSLRYTRLKQRLSASAATK